MSEYKSSQQSIQAWRNYVPGNDDVMMAPPPPPLIEAEPQPQNIQAALIITISANLFVMVLIISGMVWDGRQIAMSIVAGCAYFTITTPFYLAIVTGVLTAMYGRHERETTERQRIRAWQVLGEKMIDYRQQIEITRLAEIQAQSMPVQFDRRLAEMEKTLLEDRLSVAPAQAPSTFVTPYDNRSKAAHAKEIGPPVDTTAQEALRWVSELYDDYGHPNPNKVQMSGKPQSIGRIKGEMIGSKRGEGSRESLDWLVRAGVIHKVMGGYKLDLAHFPNRGRLRHVA